MTSNNAYVESHLNANGVTGWTLRVGLFRATNVRKADRLGKSDPYAVLFVNGIRRLKSKVIKKTLNPHWKTVLEVVLTRENLGASSLQASSLTVALYDMDMIGAHDFLGAVELTGNQFMTLASYPLKRLPPWEVSEGSRIKEFPLTNVDSFPQVAGISGKLAIWSEIKLDQQSAKLLATLKIQAMQRGCNDREVANTHKAARNIQRIRRAQNGRRKYERIEFAYMAFGVACSDLKRWIKWNDLSLEEVFSELDYDASGELTSSEIYKFFRTHPSVDLSSTDIDAIIYHMDPNKEGYISHDTFIDTVRNSEEVTEEIKEHWQQHLRLKALDMKVRDMGLAWRSAAKNKNDGTGGDGDLSVAETLRNNRKRRNSRWSAEIELMKANSVKQNQQHLNSTLKASEKADALHKGWRRESKRRIQNADVRRKKLQAKLMQEHSQYLQSDDNDGFENGEQFGLGVDNPSEQERNGSTNGVSPIRPQGQRSDGPSSTSPNAARRDARTYKRTIRPPSPTEILSAYNFWERKTDKKTKKIFYCNCNTGEVQWKLPKDGKIWPPPPPVEKQEEPRISPFIDFKTSPKEGTTTKEKRRIISFNNDSNDLSFESKDLDRLALQMENFGSLRWDDLNVDKTALQTHANADLTRMYEDDDYYAEEYDVEKVQVTYSPQHKELSKTEHAQHTQDRVVNRHDATEIRINLKKKRDDHLKNRVHDRHQNPASNISTKKNNPTQPPMTMEQHRAAIKIQAVARGRRDRKRVQTLKEVKARKTAAAAERASKRVEGVPVPQPDPFHLPPEDEMLRPFLIMIKQELSREAHHTEPNKKELHDMKDNFITLAELVTNKETATRLNILTDCQKIAEQSTNKKIKKYALAVVTHWSELFAVKPAKRQAVPVQTTPQRRISTERTSKNFPLDRKPTRNRGKDLRPKPVKEGGVPIPHPDSFDLLPAEEHLRPLLVVLHSELNRESHHTEPTKEELHVLKEKFMELADGVDNKQTLISLNIFDHIKSIAENSTNPKVKKYALAVQAHWAEMFDM